MKQVIIVRKDLNMRRGKEIAQGAHASMKAVLENIEHPYVIEWLEGKFKKIAVSVDTENELMDLYNSATSAHLPVSLVLDAGLTEFNNIPTYTAVAIGPGPDDETNPITGELPLR